MRKKRYFYTKDQYYRQFGPFVWNCQEKVLDFNWKDREFGEWRSRTIWGWWR